MNRDLALLLDAGNSRLKWLLIDTPKHTHKDAFHSQPRPVCEGIADYDKLDTLAVILSKFPPAQRVLGCNVAGTKIAHLLQALVSPLLIKWIKASPSALGVQNGYLKATQLGADRWAALIGARALNHHDTVVVMAGTAMTVDALTASGDFLGGLIVPGLQLMHESLAQGTVQLGQHAIQQETIIFPRSTSEAINSGAVFAQTGAITQMLQQLEAHTGHKAHLMLSGGNAAKLQTILQPLLGKRLMMVDNLVLRGLFQFLTIA